MVLLFRGAPFRCRLEFETCVWFKFGSLDSADTERCSHLPENQPDSDRPCLLFELTYLAAGQPSFASASGDTVRKPLCRGPERNPNRNDAPPRQHPCARVPLPPPGQDCRVPGALSGNNLA